MRLTCRPRLPRRFITLLIPLSFFALIFILPLNRSADRVVDDIEDYIHIPHHHTNDTVTKEPKHPHQRPPNPPFGPPSKLPPLGEKATELGRDRKRKINKKGNGIAEVPLEEIGEGKLGKHPIETLIIEARAKAKLLQNQIPSSLEAASRLYTKLNKGAQPPLGFDRWFEFCSERNLVAWPHPGAYDSVLPYLSIPGSQLRERLTSLDEQERVMIMEFKDGELLSSRGKEPSHTERARDLRALLEPIAELVPDLTAYFNTDDLPARSATYDLRSRSRELAIAGELWDPVELADVEAEQHYKFGFAMACPPTSGVHLAAKDHILESPDEVTHQTPRSFIYSSSQSLDLCEHPENTAIHGTLIGAKPGAGPLIPLISYATTPAHTDLIGVATESINVTLKPQPWSSKTDHRVLWRGSATGMYHSQREAWQTSQRERLHLLANPPSSSSSSLAQTTLVLSQDPSSSSLSLLPHQISKLNERFFDMGFAKGGAVLQCDKVDGTCAEMEAMFGGSVRGRVTPAAGQTYRYSLDLDGNGWSSRFRRLLTSGSVVLKSTIFEEWYSTLLIPWYHYVPVQVSFNDLYDIMAFFEGVDDAHPGRSDLAAEIGANGRRFALERWSLRDAQAYLLLLMLEYSRAMSDSREAATFVS